MVCVLFDYDHHRSLRWGFVEFGPSIQAEQSHPRRFAPGYPAPAYCEDFQSGLLCSRNRCAPEQDATQGMIDRIAGMHLNGFTPKHARKLNDWSVVIAQTRSYTIAFQGVWR